MFWGKSCCMVGSYLVGDARGKGRVDRRFFFFSSRRRHTRFDCDWSSDVCSSDLQPGTVVLGKGSDLRLNLAGSAIHTYTPASGAFQATTSAGFQYQNKDFNRTNVVGRTIALGLQNVSQAASITSQQSLQPEKNLGLYGQEEVLAANQRLLLTAGGPAGPASVDRDPDKHYFYPQAAISYPFPPPPGGLARG